MTRQVHAVDGHFVISEDGVWRPGAFKTHKSASTAFAESDETLQYIQGYSLKRDPDDEDYGLITPDDLSKAASLARLGRIP